ncbi:MAG: hypothetical protein GX455_11740 [Phycisphaerae bacterium]|nr:hypothetical protein [Phycisphaerae bacterium]
MTAGDYHEQTPTRPDEGFEYDKLGNRTTLRNDGVVTTQYTHNTANEYLTVGGTTVYYDAAGNLTQDHRGYQYDYDQDNRLI